MFCFCILPDFNRIPKAEVSQAELIFSSTKTCQSSWVSFEKDLQLIMNNFLTETHSPETHPPTCDRLEFAVRALIAVAAFVMLAAFAFLLWWSRGVFLMAFAGIVFGVFLQGISEWISRTTSVPYYWSLGAVVVLLLAILGLTAWFLGAQISDQFSELAQTLPESFHQLREELQKYVWGQWMIDKTMNAPNGRSIVSHLTDLVDSVLGALTAIVVIGFIGLYGAIEPGTYRIGILHLLPKPQRERGAEVLDGLSTSLRNWLVARIVSMVILGVLTSLGLWALNVPMFLALGFLAFFLVVIPNLGPFLAAVPTILVAWTEGGLDLAWQTTALYVGIHSMESYVLLPFLQKKTVYLPPILSVIAVIFFASVGGILGAIVAAPLLVFFMVLVKMLYVEDILEDHSLKDN